MGQICSSCMDSKGEEDKGSAIQEASDVVLLDRSSATTLSEQGAPSFSPPQQETRRQSEIDAQAERLEALQQEQARLELIVSTAGRDMVAVRSMRGNTNYFDQGFGAALAKHLEQTANNTEYTPSLPEALQDGGGVVQVLSKPPWDGIMLGQKGSGLAGCAGENPNTYMDHVAESLLESAVPVKEQLFVGVGPMVENLM